MATTVSKTISNSRRTSDDNRIKFIDGLRGVAIALVVLFHAFVRWPQIVPYGNKYSDFILFSNGWLGVELFFMISGFVISMTLRNCRDYSDFMSRRWMRLFPAMLVCSLFIYATSPLLPERPAGPAGLAGMIPGLTFLSPEVITYLTGTAPGPIEGAFWSIYVEVKFYAIFGMLYFLFGELKALLIFLSFCLLTIAAISLKINSLIIIAYYADALYFIWFAIGILFHLWWRGRNRNYLLMCTALCVISPYLFPSSPGNVSVEKIVITYCLISVFAAPLFFEAAANMLSNKAFVFVGFVSYPLYLLHQNIVVALTAKMGRTLPWMPDILMPVLPIFLVVALAYIVARYIEGNLRGMLRLPYRLLKINWEVPHQDREAV